MPPIMTKCDPTRLLLKLALFMAISMSVYAQGRGARGGPPRRRRRRKQLPPWTLRATG